MPVWGHPTGASALANSRRHGGGESLGSLAVKVEMDYPYKTHYGPGSEITGHLMLQYTPKSSTSGKTAELYGPMSLSLVFAGKVTTATVFRNQGGQGLGAGMASPYGTSSAGTSGTDLFSIVSPIKDTSLRIKEGEIVKYPFTVIFPAGMIRDAAEGTGFLDSEGTWTVAPPHETPASGELPPSLHRVWVGGPRAGDEQRVNIVYTLEPKLEMPGLDVAISNKMRDHAAISYEQARPEAAGMPRDMADLTSTISVRSAHFLPADEQPHGFKAKTKALLTSSSHLPLLSLAVSIPDIPLHISIGRPISITMTARPNTDSTVHQLPSIEIKSYQITLQSRVTSRSITKTLQSGWTKGCILQGLEKQHEFFSFSKANDNTVRLVTEPVHGLTSSFESFGITLEYRMDVWLCFRFAGHEIKHVEASYPVTVWPPPRQAYDAAPGSSRRAVEDDELPAYSATS